VHVLTSEEQSGGTSVYWLSSRMAGDSSPMAETAEGEFDRTGENAKSIESFGIDECGRLART